MSVIVTICASLAIGIMYASIFEWVLHKYIMHRPLGAFRYPFEAHALTHHRLFKFDYTYHAQPDVDVTKIRMARWNGPVLVLVGMIPVVLVALAIHRAVGTYEALAIFGTAFCVFSGYYLTYEYLHWCMHLPHQRRVEHSRIFRALNGHHVLHHRYMGKNFNVVFPFADMLFGTLLLRSPVAFAQVRGSAVPDLQPIAV